MGFVISYTIDQVIHSGRLLNTAADLTWEKGYVEKFSLCDHSSLETFHLERLACKNLN